MIYLGTTGLNPRKAAKRYIIEGLKLLPFLIARISLAELVSNRGAFCYCNPYKLIGFVLSLHARGLRRSASAGRVGGGLGIYTK